MPAKRNRSKKHASDENRPGDQNRGRSSPAFPYEADENLQKGYGAYDEEKNSSDPRYQQNFDIDENDIDEGKDEYKNLKNGVSGNESGNMQDNERRRSGD
ncbi:MAG TPA: hypothetical protein VFP87_07210 [Chitinophagaceae bacterium]|nr:hypothetical protein [Chitinophagaceae bacterium]